jgi:predicted dehydrogenase
MSDRIRVGIVGATVTVGGSGWGAHAHVPALTSLSGYELKAVCTAHEDTAKASAAAFGAELAFSDYDRMLAHPDIDLIAVVVRVPQHYELTMKALRARKATFCEWPLGANLAEAEELADVARASGLATLVGLQGRSDSTVRFARELITEGYVGDVLVANLSVITSGQYVRGKGRIWQSQRKNGANTLTISGGHSMDATRFIIGDFVDITARVTTLTREWLDSDTGHTVDVDSPDTIGVVARTPSGAEVTMQIATVPTAAPGSRLEIYGTAGRLVLTSESSFSTGPNRLLGAKGKDDLTELAIPSRFIRAPAALVDAPPSINVAQAYVRFAEDRAGGRSIDPDFQTALGMHRIIEAIERAAGVSRL